MNRRILLAVLAAMAWASCASAQTKTVVDVSGIQDGQYLLVISGGTVSVSPIVILVPGDVPDPPDPPGPDDLTEFGKQIKAVSDAIPNQMEAKGSLASVYQMIADQVTDGKITSQAAVEVSVKYMSRHALSNKEQAALKPLKEALDAQWAKLLQQGASVGDFGSSLTEAADGINSTLPADMQQVNWERLLEILMWFIENILPLFLSAGVTLP